MDCAAFRGMLAAPSFSRIDHAICLYSVWRSCRHCLCSQGSSSTCMADSLLAINAQKAYAIMSLSIVVFTFLAMIVCKENGILLPLLIGVLQKSPFWRANSRDSLRSNRYWSVAFILLPSTAIARIPRRLRSLTTIFSRLVPPRNFSLYERFLTEPRILVDYLQALVCSGALHRRSFPGSLPKVDRCSLAGHDLAEHVVAHFLDFDCPPKAAQMAVVRICHTVFLRQPYAGVVGTEFGIVL